MKRSTRQHIAFAVTFVCLLTSGFIGGLAYAYQNGNPLVALGFPTTTQTLEHQSTNQDREEAQTPITCDPEPSEPEESAPRFLSVDVNVTSQQHDMLFAVRVTNPTTDWDIRIYRENFRLIDENNTVHPVDFRTYHAQEYAFPTSITLRSGQSSEGALFFTGEYDDPIRIEYHDTSGYTTVTGFGVVPDE